MKRPIGSCMNIDWKENTLFTISPKQQRYTRNRSVLFCSLSLCFFILTLSLCFFFVFSQNEWVICRVFQKCSGGKKTHISGLVRLSSYGNDQFRPSSLLPPLMESHSPPYNKDTRTTTTNVGKTYSHVTCFSEPMEDQKTQQAHD